MYALYARGARFQVEITDRFRFSLKFIMIDDLCDFLKIKKLINLHAPLYAFVSQ